MWHVEWVGHEKTHSRVISFLTSAKKDAFSGSIDGDWQIFEMFHIGIGGAHPYAARDFQPAAASFRGIFLSRFFRHRLVPSKLVGQLPIFSLKFETSRGRDESDTLKAILSLITEEDLVTEKLRRTDSEWKKLLTENQYYVTRQKGTEPPYTGEYEDTESPGTYKCVCCGQPLFRSEAKFNSGCGWPSFSSAMNEEVVETELDSSHGMRRVEIKCSRCDAHLGHVFEDGPQPTGLRYCVNSASLNLEEE